MKDLKVFIPEHKEMKIPDHPIRTIGIDLGTTNSTVAQAIWDPDRPEKIDVACIEVEQFTENGLDTDIIVPSVVALHKGRTWIGKGAKELRSKIEERGLKKDKSIFYHCKNEMGIEKLHRAPEGFQSPAQISGQVLFFLKKAAIDDHEIPLSRTVVTVPSSFRSSQRIDTQLAAQQAGMDVQNGNFLDEPIAAFIDYILSYNPAQLGKPGESKNLIIFDFGGGTCDVALFKITIPGPGEQMKSSPLAVSRYHRLGGGDIDTAILHDILIPQIIEQNDLDPFLLGYEDKALVLSPTFLSAAEALKINLCTEIDRLSQFGRYENTNREEVYVRLNQVFPDPRFPLVMQEGVEVSLRSPELNAAQFEKILEPFLDQDYLYPREDQYRVTCSIFAPLDDVLERSDLQAKEIDYLLCVGGSSLIPQVQEALQSYFHNADVLPFPDKNAVQTAIARGAAYHALSLELFDRGLIQPVSNEDICIKTKDGLTTLIPRQAPLPYPEHGEWGQNSSLVVPQTNVQGALPLRIEIVDGEERRLFHKVWNITALVNKGDPLNLEYRMDANQLLELKLSLVSNDAGQVFAEKIENPLTNVVNPDDRREEILLLEQELRKEKFSKSQKTEKMMKIAELQQELGDREKALAVYKRVLKMKNGQDVNLLNKMGILCGEMGDYEKQEKFYRQASKISNWGGPLFNLALAQRQRDNHKDAILSVKDAIQREEDAPYFVLLGLIRKELGEESEMKKNLDKSFELFEPLEMMDDWSLQWYGRAANLLQDAEKLEMINKEKKRRKKKGAKPLPEDDSVLPVSKSQSPKEVL